MVVESFAVSLVKFCSPPPDTVAVFVSREDAFGETFTVTVIGGYTPPGARASVRVHVRLLKVHVQPEPDMLAAVSPVGKVSTTMTVPAVGADPALFTMIEYEAPFWPKEKLPTCDFVIVRSGGGVMIVVSLAVSFVVFCSPPPDTVT
jgi:hypothetical protein